MKKNKYLLITLLFCGFNVMQSVAQCEIHLMAADVNQIEGIPDVVNEQIKNRLTTLLTNGDVAVNNEYSQFFITGKFTHNYKDVLPGPPTTHVINTSFMLYIGDNIGKTVFETYTIDLKGVGNTETRAYINALSNMNSKNPEFFKFIQRGKDKVIKYYDNNFKTILNQAGQAAQRNNFKEALMYTSSIPSCSKGYKEASDLTYKIFQKYIDYEGSILLTKAKGAWAQNPTEKGANEARGYIEQIDPSSKSFVGVGVLLKEISKVINANWTFENKTKYRDEVELRKHAITAAVSISKAYAKAYAAENSSTRIYFLR